jgi:lysophospholipase L1-like esterase
MESITTDMTTVSSTTRRHRRVVTSCVALMLVGIVIESGARLAFAHKNSLIALLPTPLVSLHDYQERDPRHPESWRLKPGFVRTFGQTMIAGELGNLRADDIFIRINADGFRGPEIDRTDSHPRILAIGDSCTFGTIEQFSYPRVLEDELRRRGEKNVEVINAGVEGYGPRDALYQVDRYSALRPSITTIYLGWGPLYNETHAVDGPLRWSRLDSVRLMGRTASYALSLIESPQRRTQRVQQESKQLLRADISAPEISRLDRFIPIFMPQIEQLVRVLRSTGTTVVLITLPGLYTLDSPPTERALRIGNLPQFTRNTYVLAKMTARYNEELRSLAKREGLHVVDLDAWSRANLVPPENHFVNAVHLNEEAQELAGRYMGEVLEPVLRGLYVRSGD